MPRRVERLAADALTSPVRVTVGEVGAANEDITQVGCPASRTPTGSGRGSWTRLSGDRWVTLAATARTDEKRLRVGQQAPP